MLTSKLNELLESTEIDGIRRGDAMPLKKLDINKLKERASMQHLYANPMLRNFPIDGMHMILTCSVLLFATRD